MKLGQWIGLLSFVAAAYLLWDLRQSLLLIFAAVVLANSLNLLAQQFQKRGLKRGMAALLAVGIFVAAIVFFVLLIVPPFAKQFQELIGLLPEGIRRLNGWINGTMTQIPPQFRTYVPGVDSLVQQAQPYANRLLGGSFAIFSSSLGVVVNILLVLVLALMMLVDPLAYRGGFIRLVPSFYRRRVDEVLLECEVSLGRWIVGALISMSVVAVLSSVGLALLGVRVALAQGVLAGLLNFIPNIGPTLSVVLPMTIALLDDPWKPLFVLALYFAVQQFESNLLTPYVMSQQVSLLPAVTLVAQVFFASIFGFLGLALAIPLTVVSQIFVRRVLMEDILDRWQHPTRRQLATAPGGDSPAIATDTVLNQGNETVQQEVHPGTGEVMTQRRSSEDKA